MSAGSLPLLDCEIRASNVVYEERVAGKRRPGLVASITVDQRESGVLRPVPGCVDGTNQKLPDLQLESVVDRDVVVLGRSLAMDVDRRSGRRRQPAVPRDVVGVVVRLENVLDRDARVPSELEVLVDLELRVDDSRLPGALVTDEVGRATEVVVDDLAEDHRTACLGVVDQHGQLAELVANGCADLVAKPHQCRIRDRIHRPRSLPAPGDHPLTREEVPGASRRSPGCSKWPLPVRRQMPLHDRASG